MRSFILGCLGASLFACTSAPQDGPPEITPLFVGDALIEVPNPKGFCVRNSRQTSDGRTSVVLMVDCRLQDAGHKAIPEVRGLLTISATETGPDRLRPDAVVTAFEIANPQNEILVQTVEEDALYLKSERDGQDALANQSSHALFQVKQSFLAISLTGFAGERLRDQKALGFLRQLTKAILSANLPES